MIHRDDIVQLAVNDQSGRFHLGRRLPRPRGALAVAGVDQLDRENEMMGWYGSISTNKWDQLWVAPTDGRVQGRLWDAKGVQGIHKHITGTSSGGPH